MLRCAIDLASGIKEKHFKNIREWVRLPMSKTFDLDLFRTTDSEPWPQGPHLTFRKHEQYFFKEIF
jgi:hypothetical protein